MNWNGKPYHSLDFYLRDYFGEKLYKLALDGGMTCPNRDGTLDSRGCIFCSAGGSGDFAGDRRLSEGKGHTACGRAGEDQSDSNLFRSQI